MSDTPFSAPPGSLKADVTLQRPSLWADVGRMALKIIVGALLIAVFGFLAAGAISAGFAAGFAGSGGAIEAETEQTEFLAGEAESDTAILVVDIDGVILNHAPRESDGFFASSGGVAYGYEIKEMLIEAAEADDVQAVMLHVSTPGGSISGSNAIHEGVLAVKEAGKPIAAYVDGISASGGVWSTAAVDAIFADHGSVVGSVGVLGPSLIEYVEPVALGGLFYGVETRGGLTLHVTSAGRGKDLGNPFRTPTDEEKGRLNDMVVEYYEDFLAHMESQRGLSRTLLEDQLGATILANRAAEDAGFINGTKTFDEVADWLGEQLEVGEDYRLITPRPEERGFFNFMVESRAPAADADANRQAACASLQNHVVAMAQQHRAALCGW